MSEANCEAAARPCASEPRSGRKSPRQEDKSTARFIASNARFKQNGYKVAKAKFAWWNPRRYVVMNQARRFGNVCGLFCYMVFKAGKMKSPDGRRRRHEEVRLCSVYFELTTKTANAPTAKNNTQPRIPKSVAVSLCFSASSRFPASSVSRAFWR